MSTSRSAAFPTPSVPKSLSMPSISELLFENDWITCIGVKPIWLTTYRPSTCAAVPPIPGLSDAGYLTNESVFELRERPEHLIIVGGGPIGIEMSQSFRRLGSRVTVIESQTYFRRSTSHRTFSSVAWPEPVIHLSYSNSSGPITPGITSISPRLTDTGSHAAIGG